MVAAFELIFICYGEVFAGQLGIRKVGAGLHQGGHCALLFTPSPQVQLRLSEMCGLRREQER